MDTVWIVMLGEIAKSGEIEAVQIKAVCPTLSSAITHAGRISPHGGGVWTQKQTNDDQKPEWISGSSVLRIERHRVHP